MLDHKLCPDPPVEPRGTIHSFNLTALDPQTPKMTAPDSPKLEEGFPLSFHTMGKPGVLPLMGTYP